jgi:uncharacterized protein (TIGR03437 family)
MGSHVITGVKRLVLLALLACVCAWAQQTTSIHIGTNPNGPIFVVDGQQYTTSQVFVWPVGSKHIVQFLLSVDPVTQTILGYQATNYDAIRYSFGSWTDNTGLLGPGSSPVQTITASPALTSLIANVSVLYRVHINFNNGNGITNSNCAGAPGDAPPAGLFPGLVYFDNQCVGDIADFWVTTGSHALNAFPYPGFVFLGWAINGGPNTYLVSLNVQAPIQVTPLWEPAKRVHFLTNPPGLSVLVDHSPVPTSAYPHTSAFLGSTQTCVAGYAALPPGAPKGFSALCVGDFDFVPGSKHSLGASSPQSDAQGNVWVFSGFDNGLKQNDTYLVDTNTSTADTVTANFIPGMAVTILTNPAGMKVVVDGNTTGVPPYNFIWGQGETHHLVAPDLQSDSHSRKWAFATWSNKGSATQDITVPTSGTGLALTATFSRLGQVQVTSNPQGMTLTVDGARCATPCTLDRASGTQIQVTAPTSLTTSPVSRYDFASWSDGTTGASDTVTFNQDVQTVTASYRGSYFLVYSSNPPDKATFTFDPPSSDGFYAQDTQVTITSSPKAGFKFRRWDGDLFGPVNPGTVSMDGPHAIVAMLDKVPYIAPAAIETAAGPTPDGSVAPASLISIYGDNLAPALKVGPSNPLTQAIGDVTVSIGSHMLPLMFVSPGQINAQVPSGLPDGNYSLTVHSLGQPDVTGSMTIARNAPALFQNPASQDQPLALASHQDGTPITFSSPARAGESVTLYGTGFGPYDHVLPDGFPAPSTDTFLAADTVTLNLGGVQVQPDFAGAAKGMVGMQLVRFTITPDIPSAATLDVTVSVNGKSSSKVSLPVQ